MKILSRFVVISPTKEMEITELAKHATAPDKHLAAQIHNCHYDYVDKILRGQRKNADIERTLRVIVEERVKLKERLIKMREQEGKA